MASLARALGTRTALACFGLACAGVAAGSPAGADVPPVLIPPVEGEMTASFTYTPYEGGRAAVTFACRPGEEVRAPTSGVVAFLGEVAGRPAVSISLSGGWRVTVGQLRSDEVVAGAQVRTGTRLGTCPDVGQVSLSLRRGGAYVDPAPSVRSGRLREALWLGGAADRPGLSPELPPIPGRPP